MNTKADVGFAAPDLTVCDVKGREVDLFTSQDSVLVIAAGSYS